MATEIKCTSKEIRFTKEKFIIYPIIGKTREIDYSATKRIEYRFAKPNRNGTFCIVKRTDERENAEFKLKENDNVLSVLDKLAVVLTNIELIDLNAIEPDEETKPILKRKSELEAQAEFELLSPEEKLVALKQQELLMQQDSRKQDLLIQAENIKIQKQQLKLQEKQEKATAKCPRCGSTSLSGNKKGYGVVKGGLGALALGAVTGGVGTVVGLGAGNIGRKKVLCTCMKCGKRFKA